MAEGTNDAAAEKDDDVSQPDPGALPATYIDTWHVWTWKGHMRITFGEEFPDVRYLRSAVVMTLHDAELLANMMLRMAEVRRKKDEEKTETENKRAD